MKGLVLILFVLGFLAFPLVSAEVIYLDSDTNPEQEVIVSGETYNIQLVSATDNSATVRVTGSSEDSEVKEINEGSSKTVGGLSIRVNEANEENLVLSAVLEVVDDDTKASCREGESETKEIDEGFSKELIELSTGVSLSDETNLVISSTVITDATRLSLSDSNSSEEVRVEGKTYIVELISATDNSATVRVTNNAGKSEAKAIDENTVKKINGVSIAVINADETNYEISAVVMTGISSYGLSSDDKNSVHARVNNQDYTIELVSASDTAATIRVTCGKKKIDDEEDDDGVDGSGEENEEGEEDDEVECQGCSLNGECYPIGYRTSEAYCSNNNEFVTQFSEAESCNNNFECDSNICVSGECVSGSLIMKIINWFKGLFG